MRNYTTIVVGDSGPVRTITLNRPEHRNAMSPGMLLELQAALEDVAASSCRVLVLAGAGDAFCAGLDLSALQDVHEKSLIEHRADAERLARLFLELHELPVPTIAMVHGPAIAGGTGLAMICDFTLATPQAKFGFTEVRIGFVPAIVAAFLSLQIGQKQCSDLFLTGRLFAAEEAFRLGLVNEIVEPERLVERTRALAGTLLANGPQALIATKRLIVAQNNQRLNVAIADAIDASVQARMTSDFREGVAAFLEKRKPAWTK